VRVFTDFLKFRDFPARFHAFFFGLLSAHVLIWLLLKFGFYCNHAIDIVTGRKS